MAARAPIPWLRPLAWMYGLGVALRNAGFDRGLREVGRLPVPVLSVGNLAAGGTNKTPLVAWLVARLRRDGLRVGVLARGYGREPGRELNDEGRLLAGRFPDLPQVQDPDRVAGGLRLCAGHELDVVLLDDGFQHRRLHRDADLVCLDAADPGGGGLLPAGWLREPPSSLRRADLLVFTGAGRDDGERARLEAFAERWAPGRPRCRCRLEPDALVPAGGGPARPAAELRGRRVLLLAGIARPERFRASVEALGAEVLGARWLDDHAAIPGDLLAELSRRAEGEGATLLLTEKDEARLDLRGGPARSHLRMELVFDEEPDPGRLLPRG
ncbi:MAG: tetraacyldisaccharide 4'-kinase [Planctomycetota bacterium]